MVKIIYITPKRGRYAGETWLFLVDDEDYENLEHLQKPWRLSHCRTRAFPYAYREINGEDTSMQRYIMGLRKGDKRHVDHKNKFSWDNRRENLEPVPPEVNLARVGPRSQRSADEFRGVYLKKTTGKYIAKLGADELAHFISKVQAALAVNIAYQAYYGPNAKVYANSIPEGVELPEEQKRKVLSKVADIKAKKMASQSCSS